MTDWGSNVQPKNFGRTGEPRPDWECICGHTNKGSRIYKKANREVCQTCGVERELVEEAQRRE